MIKYSVLVVEDERSLLLSMEYALSELGLNVLTSQDGNDAINKIKQQIFDVIVLDMRLPGKDGNEVFAEIKERLPESKVIIITAYGNVDSAVRMIKNGAYYYLTKPFDLEELKILVKRALDYKKINDRLKKIEKLVKDNKNFYGIVGVSSAIQKICETILTLSKSPAPVLITGETGTGKELTAMAIHNTCKVYKGPFVAVNTAGIPETLIDSEFFGYTKGAFTGAMRDKKGKIELANNGTLFLDEIGDLPVSSQAKLLRVLEEKAIEPLGSEKKIRVDFRLISATNRNLEYMVERGEFRRDLFFRINTIHIHIPPLRERREDIPFLLDYFLSNYAIKYNKPKPEISVDVVNLLTEYNFPGNVRELKNIVEHFIIFGGNRIKLMHIPSYVRKAVIKKRNLSLTTQYIEGGLKEKIASYERDILIEAYQKAGGRIKKAAEMLGISRKTFWKKCKQYEIDLKE